MGFVALMQRSRLMAGGWLLLSIIYGFTITFFRYPTRFTSREQDIVLAPADGRIVNIERVYEPEYFEDERLIVSIFLSVFNVHLNWLPVDGTVCYQQYHPGQYLVAFHPKSSELNERSTTVIETTNTTKVMVRQIAGLLARRISTYPQEGDAVKAGDELGFIKFGSRVDLLLPVDAVPCVTLYQAVRGGEDVIATFGNSPSSKV